MDDVDKNETLRAQLQNAITLAAKQDTIAWAVFSVFVAASGALLVALFPEGRLASGSMGTMLCFAGLAASVVWFLLLRRTMVYFGRYEDCIRKTEGALGIPGNMSLAIRPPGFYSNRNIMVWSVIAVAGLWGLGLFLFAVRLGLELCTAALCCSCC